MIERSHHELRKAFGDLLHGTVCKFAASVFDPISVRMASDLGFEVAIQGGSVASLQVLGAPDIALREDRGQRSRTLFVRDQSDLRCTA